MSSEIPPHKTPALTEVAKLRLFLTPGILLSVDLALGIFENFLIFQALVLLNISRLISMLAGILETALMATLEVLLVWTYLCICSLRNVRPQFSDSNDIEVNSKTDRRSQILEPISESVTRILDGPMFKQEKKTASAFIPDEEIPENEASNRHRILLMLQQYFASRKDRHECDSINLVNNDR